MNSIAYAYRRFVTRQFPLPSEQIAVLEGRVGVEFPADYRQFLLEFNGGYFDDEPEIVTKVEEASGDGLKCLFGINSGHTSSELGEPSHLATFFDVGAVPAFFPIGKTTLGGFILLVTEEEKRGAIYFKRAFGDYYYLADNMTEFLDLLRE